MMAMGAYPPIDGFMTEADWRGASVDMKLESGVFWPIPISLSCGRELADAIHIEEEVALVDAESGAILAIMEVTEKYAPDKALECEHVYRTLEPAHPGVKKVIEQGEIKEIHEEMENSVSFYRMQTMNQSLHHAVLNKWITLDEALGRTSDAQELMGMLGEPAGVAR